MPYGGAGARSWGGGERAGFSGGTRTGGGGLRDIFGGMARGAALGVGFGGVPGAVIGGSIGGLIGGLRGGVAGLGGGGAPSVGPRGEREGRGGREVLGARPRATPTQPLANALKRFTRPGPGQAPAWMRFEPVMSDLQRRSYIATEGLSGNQGLFRSSEAKDYYKNLLGQMFISPLGQPQGDLGQLLPVEQQYLMALGIPQFQDVPTLLTALGYQPS